MMRDAGRKGMPIDVRPQMLYNPAMRAPNFFVPGVIGVVLQIGTAVAAAMAWCANANAAPLSNYS
jgi:hypothetical protein